MSVLVNMGKILTEDLSEDQEKDYYHCDHCGGKNITKSNIRIKPCPKCGSRMTKDQDEIQQKAH